MALLDSAASLYQIVLTKADKLRKGEVDAVREGVLRVVARHPAAYPFVLSTSSETGDGLPELRAEIASLAGVTAPA
jgi:GTP-binding protein